MSYHIKTALYNKREHGVYWSRELSAYFNKEDGSLDKSALSLVIVRGLGAFSASFMFAAIVLATQKAGINLSIILSLFAINPFITGIAFYFLFGEQLKKIHIVGISIIVNSILILSLSHHNKMEMAKNHHMKMNKRQGHAQISILVPLMLVCVCLALFII
jgi:multidrug transporter EmrE-like cation transporter